MASRCLSPRLALRRIRPAQTWERLDAVSGRAVPFPDSVTSYCDRNRTWHCQAALECLLCRFAAQAQLLAALNIALQFCQASGNISRLQGPSRLPTHLVQMLALTRAYGIRGGLLTDFDMDLAKKRHLCLPRCTDSLSCPACLSGLSCLLSQTMREE